MDELSVQVRAALGLAQHQAEQAGKERVETNDVLVALAQLSGSIAGQYLQSRNILPDDIRQTTQGQSEEFVCGPIVQSVFGDTAKGDFGSH